MAKMILKTKNLIPSFKAHPLFLVSGHHERRPARRYKCSREPHRAMSEACRSEQGFLLSSFLYSCWPEVPVKPGWHAWVLQGLMV